MHTLTKEEALGFVPQMPKGQYQPRKYVLGGFVGAKREVLLHLYKQAVQANISARKVIEQDRLVRGIEPLNRAKKSGNTPKDFLRNPRGLRVAIPNVRKYGDAWLTFTNCKLDGRYNCCAPQPDLIGFEEALRSTQPRRLP
jgi:hypothetical protein